MTSWQLAQGPSLGPSCARCAHPGSAGRTEEGGRTRICRAAPAGVSGSRANPSSLHDSEARPSEPHKEEDAGLEEISDAVWNIVDDNTVLGRIDLQAGKITGSDNV